MIKIGTRGSALALWQTNWVRTKLESIFPNCKFEIVHIKTRGDMVSGAPLERIGGEGVFVKQIEIALLEGRIDLAVHSMKDLPTVLPDGLMIGAIPERANPADVLISKSDLDLFHLPQGARIGTSSLRRRAQLLHARDDLTISDTRGNVDTRLANLGSPSARKTDLRAGDSEFLALVDPRLDAIVLAAAGMERLGHSDIVTEVLPYDICLPAVGQGAIGVEIRTEDEELHDMVRSINHSESAAAVRAERMFLRRLGGGCRVPIASLATVDSGQLNLTGLVADRDGRRMIRSGISGDQEEAGRLGEELAELLLNMGAKRILDFRF